MRLLCSIDSLLQLAVFVVIPTYPILAWIGVLPWHGWLSFLCLSAALIVVHVALRLFLMWWFGRSSDLLSEASPEQVQREFRTTARLLGYNIGEQAQPPSADIEDDARPRRLFGLLGRRDEDDW